MALLSVTEYAKKVGKDPGNIRRLLISGRLHGQKVGKQWAIEEDTDYPEDKRVRTGEYRNWRRKSGSFGADKNTAAAIDTLIKELKGIYGNCLKRIVLYGSFARNEQTDESDVDIAVFLSESQDKAMYEAMLRCAAYQELLCGRTLSVIDIDIDTYEEWKDTLPFYRNIEKEGIVLWKSA